MTREQPTCNKCGSTNLRKDAFAEWDNKTRDWVLHSVYDFTVCDDCGEEDNWNMVSTEAA